jgi:hypothetical protein
MASPVERERVNHTASLSEAGASSEAAYFEFEILWINRINRVCQWRSGSLPFSLMVPACVYRGFYLPLKFEQGAPFLHREAGGADRFSCGGSEDGDKDGMQRGHEMGMGCTREERQEGAVWSI